MLADAVAGKLGVSPGDVEAVLADHGVSTTASTPTPAHLKFRRLYFTAIKKLTGVSSDGVDAGAEAVEEVPAEFAWELESGLQGVGSDLNLRGKTSILRILMWALRGRCDLRQDVRTWLRHVEVDLAIDATAYRIAFDVTGGIPRGELLREHGGGLTGVATFASDTEFEEVMGSAMMTALRLPVIAAAQDGRRTQHAWPAYAGALLIHSDTLDQLLGDVRFAGLPSRLLQMFVGTDWAAARAEATTAVTVAQTKLADLQSLADRQASAMNEAHARAVAAVASARQALADLPGPADDPQALADVLDLISKLDDDVAACHDQLLLARAARAEVSDQLAAERTRRQQAVEDAVAVRFFQQMRPTVCPRCSAPVTGERRRAESNGRSCSICATELDLQALSHHHVVSASAADSDRLRFTSTNPAPGEEDGDAIDGIRALELAEADAAARLQTAEAAHRKAVTARTEAARPLVAIAGAQHAAARRRDAELILARAQGAAAALAPRNGIAGPDAHSISSLRQQIRVLNAAKTITSDWVTDSQQQRLADLGAVITALARSFGMTNLTAVELAGNATMKVTTGGAQSNYSDCERGEKLRLKLATAIALIRQGRETNVGRHPGVLFVDSPGSEEMADDDFDTMLQALNAAAGDADIQVFIGTRHVDALLELLGAERCRVGRDTSFVW
jgi:hypothetical protein